MKNKVEFFVGLFIIFSFFCLIIITFKLSDLSSFFVTKKKYRVIAIFSNVGNLKVNAKVTLCGVKIGYVSNIRLVKNKLNDYHAEVELFLDSFFNFLPRDSLASIFMTNLLGENYIHIDLGNDEEFLKDGDIITLTNQALIIEDLISKFAFSR